MNFIYFWLRAIQNYVIYFVQLNNVSFILFIGLYIFIYKTVYSSSLSCFVMFTITNANIFCFKGSADLNAVFFGSKKVCMYVLVCAQRQWLNATARDKGGLCQLAQGYLTSYKGVLIIK